MSDEIDDEDLDILAAEDIPEDAAALQCGHVVGDDGIIGVLENSPLHEGLEVNE